MAFATPSTIYYSKTRITTRTFNNNFLNITISYSLFNIERSVNDSSNTCHQRNLCIQNLLIESYQLVIIIHIKATRT
nr:MAG TPA: hypothetical protein [Caudoviricetes sp.]